MWTTQAWTAIVERLAKIKAYTNLHIENKITGSQIRVTIQRIQLTDCDAIYCQVNALRNQINSSAA